VTEIEARLIDAQLGGPLLKKRLGKGGRGKSGGFRTIAAYRQRDRSRQHHRAGAGGAFRIGDEYLGLPSEKLDELVAKGTLIEVVCDGDEKEDEPNPC
jgi:hypothetical protein